MEDDDTLLQPAPHRPACLPDCCWRMRPPAGRFDTAGFVAAGALQALDGALKAVLPRFGRVGEYATDIAAMMRATQAVLAEAGDLAEAKSAVAAKAKRIDLDFVLADLAAELDSGRTGLRRMLVTAGQLRALADAEAGDEEQRIDVNEVLNATLGILAGAFVGVRVAPCEFSALPPLRCRGGEVAALLRSLLRLAFAAAGAGGAVGVATALVAGSIRIEISWQGAAARRPAQRPPEYCLACAIAGEYGGELAAVDGGGGSGAYRVLLPLRRPAPSGAPPPDEASGVRR